MANNGTKDSDYVVGLDIGTSKVVCIIGRYVDQHSLEVVSMGSYPSSGLKKGVVVNIDATTDAIQKSLDQAQASFEGKIKNVYVGIAGNHIRSLNSHGIVGIKDKEVEASDIDRVIEAAQAVAIPSDQRVLHVLPQEYVIDNQDSIREPLGMSGVRLESHVHLVTCANNAIQNIEKCVKRCGIGVDGFVLEQLASSYSVLSEDEKELGVCLVDIGGGTTDIAVFNSGSISFTGVIPIAGDQVTSDIAVALRTPTAQAEDIKQKHGCAAAELTQDGETLEVMPQLDNFSDVEQQAMVSDFSATFAEGEDITDPDGTIIFPTFSDEGVWQHPTGGWTYTKDPETNIVSVTFKKRNMKVSDWRTSTLDTIGKTETEVLDRNVLVGREKQCDCHNAPWLRGNETTYKVLDHVPFTDPSLLHVKRDNRPGERIL